MAPVRKSRSVSKRLPYTDEVSPSKGGNSPSKSNKQAISKVAAERQSKNKYPYRMSRGGYRKAKQKLEEKLKAKLKIKEQEKEKGTGIDDWFFKTPRHIHKKN